jgi:hypothetical protein
LPQPKPRRRLLLVALVFGGIGFGIAAIHQKTRSAPPFDAAMRELRVDAGRTSAPLPRLPALAEARAVPERERPTRIAASQRSAEAWPAPSVISRQPSPEWSPAPPGYFEAEVDAETARKIERKRAEERARPALFDSE